MAIPIRLHRRDDKVIKLDCTDYVIQVTRGIHVMPIWFTGERLGGDVNSVSSTIRLNCVLRDDEDCGSATSSTAVDIAAEAYMDFTRTSSYSYVAGTGTSDLIWLTGDGIEDEDEGAVSPSDIDGCRIRITSSDGTRFELLLKNAAQDNTASGISNYQEGGDTIYQRQVGIQNANTSVEFVDAIFDAIYDGTDSNWEYATDKHFKEKITMVKDIGTIALGEEPVKGALTLTQVVKGTTGETNTPTWHQAVNSVTTVSGPTFSVFSGGGGGDCFSAGDKVQNLLGVTVNNSVLGALGGLYNTKVEGEAIFGGKTDYIIGLQIPYNSTVALDLQSSIEVQGVPAGYEARNFIYGTGFGNKNKDAASNTKGASTTFDVGDRMTGIRGTIIQCEFNYTAGATIYEAAITFQPLDVMVGI